MLPGSVIGEVLADGVIGPELDLDILVHRPVLMALVAVASAGGGVIGQAVPGDDLSQMVKPVDPTTMGSVNDRDAQVCPQAQGGNAVRAGETAGGRRQVDHG